MTFISGSNALIYCRVSTDEQAEKGYSLETQERFCRDFAKRNGYTVASVYRDDGKSGTSLDRPALKALLAHVQGKQSVHAVIIQETDRLARSTIDHLTIKALLQKANVKLISVAQPMLDDSPEGNMIDTIIASVNQFQSDINSRKTKKGLQEKFDSGWWPGWAPLGYKSEEKDGRKIVVPDPDRWHLIRHGLKLYLTGNYSAIEISDELFEQGLRSYSNKKVCNSIMTNTLRNSFYAGMMKWNGQERVGNHKPMITLEEHRQVLRILDAHNLHASRRRKHHFLLLGFVFCDICGGRYTAEKHTNRSVVYYHCDFQGKRGQEKPHTNEGQNVEASVLELKVEEAFQNIQFNDEFVQMLLTETGKLYSQTRQDTEAQKRTLLNQKLGLEQKRDMAEEKLLAGTIHDNDFKRLRDRLNQELSRIHNRLIELECKRDNNMDIVRDVLQIARDVNEGYKTANYELRRAYLGLFWDRFLIQDRRIVKALPSRLMQDLLISKKVMVRGNLLPSPKLLILLKDRLYMASVREQIAKIKHLYAHLSSSKAA
jgi:DNA invertase Pin-like site-specific DNA recombinase